MNCNLKGGRGLSQLEGRVIIRTQNCNFNIDHLLLFPQIPTKACRHWAARCGLHKNPMLHLSYWELKPFHGFFPIRKLQFWVLTPPEQLERRPRRRKKKKGKLHRVVPHLAHDERHDLRLLLVSPMQEEALRMQERRRRGQGRKVGDRLIPSPPDYPAATRPQSPRLKSRGLPKSCLLVGS